MTHTDGVIFKLTGPDGREWYGLWSNICDRPLGRLQSWDAFQRDMLADTTKGQQMDFHQRMRRVEQYGTSMQRATSAAALLAGNRAGPQESTLTEAQLLAAYAAAEEVDA